MATLNPSMTVGGPVGQMDVAPGLLTLNRQGYMTVANTPQASSTGLTDSLAAPSVGSNPSRTNFVFGDWRTAPDGTVEQSSPFPFVRNYTWRLPNGSVIALAREEVRGEGVNWLGNTNAWSVRITPNTLPGMRAYGLVSSIQEETISVDNAAADAIRNANNPNNPANIIRNVSNTAAIGSGAIIVVAIVAAAIWFLPRMRGA